MAEEKTGLSKLIIGAYFSIVLGIGTYMVTAISSLGGKVAVLEATRFTSEDGARLKDSIHQILLSLERMNQAAPPQWFQEKVAADHGLLLDLDKRVREIEKKR